MRIDFLVKKVVRTRKSLTDVTWRVHLASEDGDKLTLVCDTEEDVRGYVPEVTSIPIDVVNPQTTLEQVKEAS